MFDPNQDYDIQESSIDQADQYANQTTNNTMNTARNLATKGAKAVGRKAIGTAKKAGSKLLAGSNLVLKKYILIGIGILAGILIVLVLIMAAGDFLIGQRGPVQDYSQKVEESNLSGIDENGKRKIIALTEPQALKTSYYRLMSCASYTKIYKDTDVHFYDPEEVDKKKGEDMREDFATLQDYNENERSFLLSSDFILMADEILHDSIAYYPEQVIKPLYYKIDEETENVKTLPVFDKEKNKLKEEVVSTKYDKADVTGDYVKNEEADKVPGLWDYGLGSVVQYTPKEKDVWMEGVTLTRDWEEYIPPSPNSPPGTKGKYIMHWNDPVNEKFVYRNLPIKDEKDKKIGGRKFHDPVLNKDFGNDTSTYPIKIPVIQSAALFSGSIAYEYEDKTTETPFINASSSDKYDNVNKIYIGTNHAGEPMYETREGATFTKVPQKTGEKKDVLGFDYIDEYFDQYTNYVPIGLKNDLEFKKRTEATYDILTELGLLKPYTGQVGNVELGPIGGNNSGANQELNDGINGNSGSKDWNTWNDVTLLSHLIAAEAANNKMDELMVGSVLMNRVASSSYPNSILECIKQKNQYACFDAITGGTFVTASVTPSHIASAKQVLSGRFSIPENVLYQSQKQLGTLFTKVGVHYYCTPKGQKPSTKDRFGRTALSVAQLNELAKDLENEIPESSNTDNEQTPQLPVTPNPGGAIGGQHPVEVTYYCQACNDGSNDLVAWAGGTGKGHAVVGVTCAMSKGSQQAMGMKYGDYVYINNLGIRRLEDLCGTGLGTNKKSDRIVIDVYIPTPDGICHCSDQNNLTTTAYKTTGAGSVIPGGFFDQTSGIYHVDMNNPSGFSLFDAKPFDTFDATRAYEQFNDPNQSWLSNVLSKWEDKVGDFVEGIKNTFSQWGVMKGLNSLFNKDALFTEEHYFTDPTSDISRTRDVVYQALAITQNKSYMDVLSTFDEENMDLIFVGNYRPGGMNGIGGVVNGTGTTVDGFISPTDVYYQVSEPFAPDKPYVTISTPEGIDIHAVYAGTVDTVDIDSGSVTISHAHDTGTYKVVYGNINVSVSTGDNVSAEQIIGITRPGGFTLQVFKDGKPIDPMTIFYQPSIGIGGNSVAAIAMNELQLHEYDYAPGYVYKDYWHADRSAPWCAYFAGYCYDKAGYIDAGLWPTLGEGMPKCTSCVNWLKKRGWYYPRTSGYIPKAGDAVFFDWKSNGRQDGLADHIGIVLYAEQSSQGLVIHTIEGNTGGGNATGNDGDLARKKRTGVEILGFGVPGGA